MAAAFGLPQVLVVLHRDPELEVGARLSLSHRNFDDEHAGALARAGEIDGDYDELGWGGTVQVAHDIDFWFDPPRVVARLAALFERVHPDIVLPRQMYDEDDWIGYFDPERAAIEAAAVAPSRGWLRRLFGR
ncbi:hypothetical protein ACI2IX_04185 [Leifsonia aquatica]|uniref:hypothetical protein n=1 Tax=Leifsonia aquatica TaxID=144185 RepID=UPI00385035D4